MRKLVGGLMVATMGLALVAAVGFFGAVTLEFATALYGSAVLLALLWVAKILVVRPGSWKHSPMHVPVLALMAYATVRYFTSRLEYESRLELFQILLYGFIFFLAAFNFYRSRDRTLLIGILTTIALGESIYGFYQFLTQSDSILMFKRPEQYWRRASGTYVNPNHLAGLLEMTLAMLLARVAIMRPSKESIQRLAMAKLWLSYTSLVILAGLVVTLSRAGWVATLFGFIVFILLKGWGGRTIWPRVIFATAGAIMITVIGSRMEIARDYVRLTAERQAKASQLSVDANVGTRIVMWTATLQIIRQHPWIGTGPGTWKWFHLRYRDPTMQMRPEYAHNDYLHLASDYGLIGLLLVALVFGRFFWHAWSFLQPDTPSEQRSFAMGSIIATVIILVHSMFDFNMHIPANALILVTLMGFTVAMDDRSKRFPRAELTGRMRIITVLLLLGLAGGGVWFVGRSALAERYTSLGTEAKETLDLQRAVELLEAAADLDPKSPIPPARLGDVYSTYAALPIKPGDTESRKEMLEYAIEQYHTSFKLNPYQSDVLVRLAKAYQRNDEIAKARDVYDRALAVDPHNASVFFHLGKFYLEQGEDEQARTAFEKAKALNYWTDPAPFFQLEDIKPAP